jgi:hypothetical protein
MVFTESKEYLQPVRILIFQYPLAGFIHHQRSQAADRSSDQDSHPFLASLISNGNRKPFFKGYS